MVTMLLLVKQANGEYIGYRHAIDEGPGVLEDLVGLVLIRPVEHSVGDSGKLSIDAAGIGVNRTAVDRLVGE